MERIRAAVEGAIGYLTEHPDEASYTDTSATARIGSGLRVEVSGPGGESVASDFPESVGGGASAPSPGWLFRAALAACDASLIIIEAARAGVVLDDLEVTVDSDSDDRGILGIDPGVPAGPLSVRVRVSLRSAGHEAEALASLAERALSRCPVHDATVRAVPVDVEVQAAG